MPTLLKLGDRTKIKVLGKEPGCRSVIKNLANGEVLGHYEDPAEAKQEAERLLALDTRAQYCVQDDDGKLSNWVYDLKESRRKRSREHWLAGLRTAPLLFLLAWAVFGLISLPFFDWLTVKFAAATVAFYCFAMLTQNRIESIVAWVMVLVILLLAVPMYREIWDQPSQTDLHLLNQAHPAAKSP